MDDGHLEREVASETNRRDMVRPRIMRMRWAGSHASQERAREEVAGHAPAQFLTVTSSPTGADGAAAGALGSKGSAFGSVHAGKMSKRSAARQQ